MIRYVDGDIFEYISTGEYDMFIHGCNCLHTMGSGVALGAKRFCPALYEVDKQTTEYGSRDKLGMMSTVIMQNNGTPVIMANGYTQFDWRHGRNGEVPVDLDAIRKLFKNLNTPQYSDLAIIIPKIGAGRAGGKWEDIESIILEVSPDIDITVVNYVPRRSKHE
jgi:O-acetyl-ADP-ribose deacetylase (regulator of RNase III)